MKKVLFLILALVMCFTMGACGSDTDTLSNASVPAATENDKMEKLYCSALSRVEYLLSHNFPPYAYQNELAELYSQFQELGDYKDSAEYFNRFALVENRLADVSLISTDALGQETEKKVNEYLYDEKGNIVVNIKSEYDFVVNYFDKDGKYIYHHTFENDWINNLDIEICESEDGKVSEIHWISEAGVVEIVYKYIYEDNGSVIKVEHTYSDSYEGARYFPFECIYNKDGKCIEKRLFDIESQKPYKVFAYSYDTEGRLVEEFSYYGEDPNASWTKKTYQYEGNQILFEIVEDSYGETKKYKYAYRPAYYFDDTNLIADTNK